MKNISKFLVWMSVKYSEFFLIASILMTILSYNCYIKNINKIDIIIISSAILSLAILCYFNMRPDSIYQELFDISNDDQDSLMDHRSESIWFCVFIGTLFTFLFSSVFVNTIYTKPHEVIKVNNKKIIGFTSVNPFIKNNIEFTK